MCYFSQYKYQFSQTSKMLFSNTRPMPRRSHDTAAIIITPTRELAVQIDHVIQSLIDQLPACTLTVQLFIGGSHTDNDTAKFKHEGYVILSK